MIGFFWVFFFVVIWVFLRSLYSSPSHRCFHLHQCVTIRCGWAFTSCLSSAPQSYFSSSASPLRPGPYSATLPDSSVCTLTHVFDLYVFRAMAHISSSVLPVLSSLVSYLCGIFFFVFPTTVAFFVVL